MEKELIRKYRENEVSTIEGLAKEFSIGKKKVKKILTENGVKIKKRGGQFKHGKTKTIENYKFKRSDNATQNNKKLIAVCKQTGKIFNDAYDKSGSLTKHLKNTFHTPDIPHNSYQKKKYYLENGEHWFEEYFDIKEVDELPKRKCQYCGWETTDVNNKTGAFERHLINEHDIDLEGHIENHPNDIKYHPNLNEKLKEREFLSEKENRVKCGICGKTMRKITYSHLKKHGLTPSEYKYKYGEDTLSDIQREEYANRMVELNKNKINFDKVSSYEREFHEFLKENNIKFQTNNRTILNGKEIDILIPDMGIGIEFNGNKWHTEQFGKKNKNYHLQKTIEMKENGFDLIHIFEDEWVLTKDIIKNKLKHILGVSYGPKVGARKCEVHEISKIERDDFLNENHIQGNDKSTIKIGGFHNNELIAVMTFKRKSSNDEYELSRFATKINYIVQGMGSKLLDHFIKTNEPSKIISFADRKWTLSNDNNLYSKLGFELKETKKPDYRYYNDAVDPIRRFHKFGFRKQNLINKHPRLLTENMTEKEMTTILGYDRIWDCGLFKYELDLFS